MWHALDAAASTHAGFRVEVDDTLPIQRWFHALDPKPRKG
jgi:hypothetical protein